MRINDILVEFASGGSGDSGNYFKELASAWYNGTFDTGSLQKGIKSQQDVERLLNRGIVCPDGVTRKLHIDYNSDFDGVEIYSDDYYEHGDYDDTIDSRTGQKWGPYDFMAFSDEDLSEGINEFAADDGDGGGEDDALHKYARMWWAGDEATQMQIEAALAKMGWEIGEDEGGYDNGGVFVVRAGDVNGNSYVSWSAEDLTEGLTEVDRRGFLRGLGAAAVAGAAGSAMAQSRPVDVSREFQNMRQDDPRVQHNKDIEEMARAIYEQIVATRGQPIDRRQQQMWMTIAREKATEKLSKYAPGRPAPQSQSSGFPSQGSERRVSRNIDNFESQGMAEGYTDDDIETTRQFRKAIAGLKARSAIDKAKDGAGAKYYYDGAKVTPQETARRAAERKAQKDKKGMAEGASISGDGGAVDNFRQQMANRTELAYQKGMAEAPGAETLGHNQSTVASNEKAFDLEEGNRKPEPPEADYGDDYQDMVKRVKKLAGLGPLKTQYDPARRVYRNMPTAVQPKK